MIIKTFVAGFFLFNGVPHLVKGITGETHMTPFKRVSSPVINVVWSFVNIVIAVLLLGYYPVNNPDLWGFIAGGFALSLVAAMFFGKPGARLPWHKD